MMAVCLEFGGGEVYDYYMETTSQKPKTSPKDFFINLGVVAALYMGVVSVLNLLFDVINRVSPDPLSPYVDPYAGTIKWTIASLLIVFPVYLLLSRILNTDIERNPEKRELAVRKWLVYLTLFVAGVAIAIDLIVLINTFLGGEITTRFLLKVFTVAIVLGVIFSYYLSDIKGKFMNSSGRKYFAWGASLFIVLSIAVGFFVMGSPQTQRLIRFDETRVGNLQMIQSQIVTYWQQKEVLPKNLDELKDPIGGFVIPTDPATGVSYEYVATGKLSFQLCAEFSRDTAATQASKAIRAPAYLYGDYVGDASNENWQHGVGRVCFDRTIDPERYPPLKKR